MKKGNKLLISDILYKVSNNQNLTSKEANFVFRQIISGKLSEIQSAGFLMALATKGVTMLEILEASKVLRKKV